MWVTPHSLCVHGLCNVTCWVLAIIVDSHSVDPRKLCVGVKYYVVHMYSMPYYTYGSTANFIFLVPTALIYISKERHCDEDLHGVGNFKIEQVNK